MKSPYFSRFFLGMSRFMYLVAIVSTLCSVRIMLGGDHGKFKHGPPEGHSPAYESMLPKEKVKIVPCYTFGDVPKGLICGPAEVTARPPFVPLPIETTSVSGITHWVLLTITSHCMLIVLIVCFWNCHPPDWICTFTTPVKIESSVLLIYSRI